MAKKSYYLSPRPGRPYSVTIQLGLARLNFLRQQLGLSLAEGIPSEDTRARVLRHWCQKQLEHSLAACAQHLAAAQATRQNFLSASSLS